MKSDFQFSTKARGFSLVELIVAMTVLSAILLLFVGFLDQTQRSWNLAHGRVSQFRESRIAFDIMTKNLSQATLNAYFEQYDEDGNGLPDSYEITSELHFKMFRADELPGSGHKPGHTMFFQAPLGVTSREREFGGLSNLLNARGYFVEFNSDKDYRPNFVKAPEKNRYRLMEYLPPTEENSIYIDHAEDAPKPGEDSDPDQEYFQGGSNSWYNNPQQLNAHTRPLAENVVLLILSPREPTADRGDGYRQFDARESYERVGPFYEYDSEVPEETSKNRDAADFKHTLPPLVKVVMVAIDEQSALRIEQAQGSNAEFMESVIDKGSFSAVTNYERDLEDLETALGSYRAGGVDIPISYKIFSSTVSILASKWSRIDDQENTP